MKNQFCFLKGLVECDSGIIQDCNNRRTTSCPLDQKQPEESDKKKQAFCFLKGLVDCSHGRVQDCNLKRVEACPMED